MPSHTPDHTAQIKSRQSGNEPAPIPLAEILGLAVGTPTFFVCLVLLVIHCLRKKHRRKKRRIEEVDNANCGKEMGVPRRLHRAPDLCISYRSSFNPLLTHDHDSMAISTKWREDESMMDDPPLTKSRPRRQSQINLMSGVRDSWPLAAAIQMPNLSHHFGLQQDSSAVHLSQVAPPGYMVPPEPKWPSRTFSRRSKTQIFVPAEEGKVQRFSTGSIEPKTALTLLKNHRRSTSENHLSTILRSTSQRLKSARRKSLSRNLVSFDRCPGPPPTHKLQTPRKRETGSREILIDRTEDDHAESIASSIYGAYLNRTPSPSKKESTTTRQSSQKRRRSISPSVTSDDSLCTGTLSDVAIPATLTSPSRRTSNSPQKSASRTSSGSVKEVSTMIHKNSRTSVLALGGQDFSEGQATFGVPHRVSIESDPFYSSVKRSKFTIPQNKILGPRPLYIRPTKYGREATSERPASFVSTSASISTLCDISGNAQQPSFRRSPTPTPEPPERNINPFQWEPQEAMTSRDTRSSPQSNRSRRKGHKRSNIMRISLAPSSPNVRSLPEDAEENPFRTNPSHHSSMHIIEPITDLRPRPLSTAKLPLGVQPPSIAKFDPMLPIPGRIAELWPSGDDSLTPVNDVQIYSPTLAAFSADAHNPATDKRTFNKRPSSGIPPPLNRSQRQRWTSSLPYPEHKELFCFRPLSTSNSSTVSTSMGLTPLLDSLAEYNILPEEDPPFSVRLMSPSNGSTVPTITSLHNAGSVPNTIQPTSPSMTLTSPEGVSFPSPLTYSSPTLSQSHLTSHKPQAYKSSPKNNLLNPRDSLLHQSICMLRRMNSEVSRCSTLSASSNGDEGGRSPRSPSTLTGHSPVMKSWGTGSKNYLNMGETPHKLRVTKRQSKKATREKIDEVDAEDEDIDMMESRFRTTRESGIERDGKMSIDGHSTLDSKQATMGTSSPKSKTALSPLATKRWSDATPPANHRGTRDESQIQSPSPVTPPQWGWSSKGEAGEEEKENIAEVAEVAEVTKVTPTKMKYGNWNGNFGRPDSLGLYDSDGFLINSPRNREGTLAI